MGGKHAPVFPTLDNEISAWPNFQVIDQMVRLDFHIVYTLFMNTSSGILKIIFQTVRSYVFINSKCVMDFKSMFLLLVTMDL